MIDKIFNYYFIDKEPTTPGNPNIFQYLKEYNEKKDKIEPLLEYVMEYLTGLKYITIGSGGYGIIKANKTQLQRFKNNGGFKALYHNQDEVKEKQGIKEQLESLKLKYEVEFLEFQNNQGKKMTKWGFGIAIASFVISLLGSSIGGFVVNQISIQKEYKYLNFDNQILNKKVRELSLHIEKLETKKNTALLQKTTIKH